VRALGAEMVAFPGGGDGARGAVLPGAFLDLTMPAWRIQARALRISSASASRARRPTPGGFFFEFEFEKRWDYEGQQWYAREMMRDEVNGGQVAELTVYCTGDWDQARQGTASACWSPPPGTRSHRTRIRIRRGPGPADSPPTDGNG
jgi:hypothetical protein